MTCGLNFCYVVLVPFATTPAMSRLANKRVRTRIEALFGFAEGFRFRWELYSQVA